MNLEKIKNNPYKSLGKYAVPSVIGMLLTSLITIIDGAFISRNIGNEGLAAINLGLPILYLFLGIAIMLGVGGSTLATNRLGAGRKTEANNNFIVTAALTLGTTILLTLFFRFTLPIILNIFDLKFLVQNYMIQYYNTILLFYPLMMLNIVFGMFIRGEGRPEVFMLISILTNVINIYFDYRFIYKLSFGMTGAALASGIAISVGFIINIIYFLNKLSIFKFKKPEFFPEDIKTICFNGSSELIGQMSMAITTALFNMVVLNIMGVTGVAAITIIGYLGYIHSMVVTGIGQGMSPMISFGHGAGDLELIKTIKACTQKIVFILGLIIVLFIIFASELYVNIFTSDKTLINIVNKGIKIYGLAFIVNGFNIISSFFFTSIGEAKESVIISSLRGLLVLSLSIIILPLILKEFGIWAAVPLTEILTFIVALKLIKENKLVSKTN